MAIIAQAFGGVKIDKAAGTLVDISAQVASCELMVSTNAGTYMVLGNAWGLAVDGKKTWSVNLEILMTTGLTETEAYDIISIWMMTAIPGARTIEIYTPDITTVGSFKFSGEVKIQTMERITQINAESNQPQRFRCVLLGDGTLTKAAVT